MESAFDILGWVSLIGFVLATTLIYAKRPDLNSCAFCGRFMSMKAQRFWCKHNGNDVPVCSRCFKDMPG